jgi:hypothetical protein
MTSGVVVEPYDRNNLLIRVVGPDAPKIRTKLQRAINNNHGRWNSQLGGWKAPTLAQDKILDIVADYLIDPNELEDGDDESRERSPSPEVRQNVDARQNQEVRQQNDNRQEVRQNQESRLRKPSGDGLLSRNSVHRLDEDDEDVTPFPKPPQGRTIKRSPQNERRELATPIHSPDEDIVTMTRRIRNLTRRLEELEVKLDQKN